MFERHNCIFSGCVVVLAHDIHNITVLINVTHNTVDSVCPHRISEFIYRSLYSPVSAFVVSFVHGLVWRVFFKTLCIFADGPSDALFIDMEFCIPSSSTVTVLVDTLTALNELNLGASDSCKI